jgi:hypothetical protein
MSPQELSSQVNYPVHEKSVHIPKLQISTAEEYARFNLMMTSFGW